MASFFRSTSLVSKVIWITSLVLVVAISLSIWLHIRLHEESIKKLTFEKTKVIAEFVEKNLIHSMVGGKHFEIHQILKNFTYGGIWKINVFKKDGTISASTHEAELSTKAGDIASYLNNQYFIREESLRNADGREERKRIYYFNRPVLNKPECFRCHLSEENVIGVVSVANSLEEMDQELRKAKWEATLLALITIGSLSLALGFLSLKLVNAPIRQLIQTMRRVEQGDLYARTELATTNEMGTLAENLNAMIGKLQATKAEAEQYHQDLVQRADRMASIGELASGMAHEIRNPLAGIQGAIQILADRFPEGDEARRVTDEIQKQIFRLEQLVKDLLHYAKPAPPHYILTDVNDLAERVLSFSIAQKGKTNHVKIDRRLSSALPKLMIDPNSMEQAFLNIILNARKAMPLGGALTVSTDLLPREKEGETEVRISFKDTGLGIPAENLTRIFNPFFSTRSDGTGLGLSITKNIVQQHGGRIDVESTVHVGSTFTITLPVKTT